MTQRLCYAQGSSKVAGAPAIAALLVGALVQAVARAPAAAASTTTPSKRPPAATAAGAGAAAARRGLIESSGLRALLQQPCPFTGAAATASRALALSLLVEDPVGVVASMRGPSGNGLALCALGDGLIEEAKLTEAAAAAACAAVLGADALKVALASVDLSMAAAERAAARGGVADFSNSATWAEDTALAGVQAVVRWTQAAQDRARQEAADAAEKEKGGGRASRAAAPFVFKQPAEQLGALLGPGNERVVRNLLALARAVPTTEELGGDKPAAAAAGAAAAGGRVCFTPERMSPADCVKISKGGAVARMESGSNGFVVLSTEISSGRASWEIKLVEDAMNGECVAFGVVALWPVTDVTYNSNQMLTYRGYNGECYELGSTKGTNEKYHPGDVVRMDLDMGAGTLAFAVNGAVQPYVFTGVKGPVTPVVMFYSASKTVELMSFKGNGTQTHWWAPHALATIVRNSTTAAATEEGRLLRASLWASHALGLLRARSIAMREASVMLSYVALQCLDADAVLRGFVSERPETGGPLDVALETVDALDDLEKLTKFCRSPASAPSSESGWNLFRCVTCHGAGDAPAGTSGTIFDRALCCPECAAVCHAGHEVVFAAKVTEKGICGEEASSQWSGGDLGALKSALCTPERVVGVMAAVTNPTLGRPLQLKSLDVFSTFSTWSRSVLDVVVAYDSEKLKAGQVGCAAASDASARKTLQLICCPPTHPPTHAPSCPTCRPSSLPHLNHSGRRYCQWAPWMTPRHGVLSASSEARRPRSTS